MRNAADSLETIGIIVEKAAFSQFLAVLQQHLVERYGCEVVICLVDGPDARDGGLATLLQLERLVLRRGRRCWADPCESHGLPIASIEALRTCCLIIDLSADGARHLPVGVPVLQPHFAGRRGEMALAQALFYEGTPPIAIVEAKAAEAPRMLVDGVASLEDAAGIGGAMHAVWSRVLILLDKVLVHAPGDIASPAAPPSRVQVSPAAGLPLKSVALRSARMIAYAAAHAAYRLCCHAPHWRIGWRMVDEGQDVWSRRNLEGVAWRVLQAPHDRFYADPFPFRWQGKDLLFFEDLPYSTQKGIISYCVFDESGRPGPRIPIIEEPWHLSYPFLFEEGGDVFMIPEASLSGEITLYRASRFPDRWERHATLVSNVEAADATIVRHQGRLWMFAVTREGVGGYSDTLAIWSSERLTGPWTSHKSNPVMVDDRLARPAGNFVSRGGRLYRPVQDARKGYGTALNLMRVEQLDDDGFRQVLETQLRAGGAFWPGRKIHTLSSNGYLEAIDGTSLQPKSKRISDLMIAKDPLEHL